MILNNIMDEINLDTPEVKEKCESDSLIKFVERNASWYVHYEITASCCFDMFHNHIELK